MKMHRNLDPGSKVDHEGVHLNTATIWSAPAERSGDGALAPRACLATLKGVSRSACHRNSTYSAHNELGGPCVLRFNFSPFNLFNGR